MTKQDAEDLVKRLTTKPKKRLLHTSSNNIVKILNVRMYEIKEKPGNYEVEIKIEPSSSSENIKETLYSSDVIPLYDILTDDFIS